MPKQFISFQSRGKDGPLATVVLATDKIIAIERQLSSAAVLINGAAWSISTSDALRISKELLAE